MPTRYHPVAQSSTMDKLRPSKSWQALVPDKRTLAILTMLTPILLALALAGGHVGFLLSLVGRNVEDYKLSEFSARALNNTFPNLIQILLLISLTGSLAQVMWSIARRSSLTIAQLDGLFTLPSVSSIVSHPRLLLFVEVPFLIVVILALPLITIFAPAAMVTSLPNPTTMNVSVRTIDLHTVGISNSFASTTNIGYPPPSPAWMSSAQTAMEAPAPVSWPIPPPTGCLVRCNYTITYAAPTLTCLDLRTDQIWVGDSSSSIPPPGTLITLDSSAAYNATAVNGTMTLAWTPYNFNVSAPLVPGQPQGVTCTFLNATYRASISYLNGSQSSWTEAISTGERLGVSTDISATKDTLSANIESAAFVDAFVSFFNVTYSTADWFKQNPAPPLFILDVWTFSLRPGLSSPSERLTSLVGNVTLSLITYTNATTFVELESQSDQRLYDLRAFPLALTYGVTFLLSVMAMVLGLRALMGNRTFRPVSFSQFLLTTHNPEMDRWMEAGSGYGGLALADEELATRMTFDGTSFQPIWATKETIESDDEERTVDLDRLHPHGRSEDSVQNVEDHDQLHSDRNEGPTPTDFIQGTEAEDGTLATGMALTLHSTQSDV